MKRWDIFCKIVDNFGDIGICWRLARQLQREHALQVRLFVDDLQTAQKIILRLNADKKSQIIENIEINAFENYADVADVVIEAFACGLPDAYKKQMTTKTIWVNCDYLSAENWVDDFHGKPSPQADGLTRYFYFPGFTKKTGGLIREHNLPLFKEVCKNDNTSALKISLFCYPHAPRFTATHFTSY